MPEIKVKTFIQANKKIVFDLSRSVDLYKISPELSSQTAIAGITSGLIGLQETVTWRAKHFGFYQKLTSEITELEPPFYFADKMKKGIFKKFTHKHYFEDLKGGTLMTDLFVYRSPLGFLGKMADQLFLKAYMREFLKKRNRVIKDFAESEKWKQVLPADISR